MPYNSTAIPPSEEITGSSSLPLARVKRILSLDPSIHACSASAAFTITLATELFIRHLTTSASRIAKADSVTSSSSSRTKSNNSTINNAATATTIDATTALGALEGGGRGGGGGGGGRVEKTSATGSGKRSGRRNLQYRDFANAVSRMDNLEFLGDVIPKTTTYKAYKEQRAIRTAKSQLSRQVSGNIVTGETIDGEDGEAQANGEGAEAEADRDITTEKDTMQDMDPGEGQPSSSKQTLPPPQKKSRSSKPLPSTDTRQMTLDTKTGVPIRPLPPTQDPKSPPGVHSAEQPPSETSLQGVKGIDRSAIGLDGNEEEGMMIQQGQRQVEVNEEEEEDRQEQDAPEEEDIDVPAPAEPRDGAAIGRYTHDGADAAIGEHSSQGTDEDVDMG